MKLSELKQEILNNKPIRVQGLLKKRKETFEEFLYKFFTDWNKTKNTIYVENSKVQTEPDKRRSIGDIFLILNYYYPNIGLKKVIKFLYEDAFNKIPRFRSSYCYTIQKRVFYQGHENENSNIFDDDQPDEYDLTVEDWQELY